MSRKNSSPDSLGYPGRLGSRGNSAKLSDFFGYEVAHLGA